jgi:hypothetical protein
MTEPITLRYAPTPRTSRLAIASIVISAISLPLFFLVIPALIALVFAIVAQNTMQKAPHYIGGSRFASLAITLSAIALFLGVGFHLLVPATRRNHGGAYRAYCSANLTGILKAANVYANDHHGAFPVVPYAPYTAALNNPSYTATASTADASRDIMFAAPPANVAGSPMASLWILVLKGYTGTKQYICKSDPRASTVAPVSVRGAFPTNFTSGDNISYSVAYPWRSDGSVGKWWTAVVDASLPLMSDMAPLQHTGTPARVLNPASIPANHKTWNSANHDGEGQVVGWSDAHAGFEKRPDVGHDQDNIYTTSATGRPTQFGGFPATPLFPPAGSISLPPSAAPPAFLNFDIIMVPVRNATTGAM